MKLASLVVASGFLASVAHAGDMGAAETPGHGTFQPPARVEHPRPWGFHIERGANEQGYFLLIHAQGLDPKAVQVAPAGRSLLISVTRSLQSEHRHSPPPAHPGYTHWGYSSYHGSSALQRRISVPRDADIDAMQRTENEAMILISLPRYRREKPPGQHD